jgi:hypothetical protein
VASGLQNQGENFLRRQLCPQMYHHIFKKVKHDHITITKKNCQAEAIEETCGTAPTVKQEI